MSIFVLAFESTHAAMAAGKALKDGGFTYQTIPVPTSITAGCGIAQRFEADDPQPVLDCVFANKGTRSGATLHKKLVDGRYETVPLD